MKLSWKNINVNKILNNYKTKYYYRNFKEIQNIESPYSIYNNKIIVNWCNNDYSNLTQDPDLKKEMIKSISKFGCGSSGTRNISGTHKLHSKLETTISNHHNKEKGLIFNSGFMANIGTIQSFGKLFPDSIIFSDSDNHASIINGIKLSKLQKIIFKHNDYDNLEYLIKKYPNKNKILIVESIYSMDGSICDFDAISLIKNKYDCFTYIDEIHAVGVYGNTGAGLTEYFNKQNDFDIIMGGFGKGYGIIGGYITGNNDLIDCIRLVNNSFIFTTSMPPFICKSIIKSIDLSKQNILINNENRNNLIKYFKSQTKNYNLNLIKNSFENSHIQSIFFGCPYITDYVFETLISEHNHYCQSIKYPTVPLGEERIRISLKHTHTKKLIDDFLNSINIILNYSKL